MVMNPLLGIHGISNPLLLAISPKSEGRTLSITRFFKRLSLYYVSCLMLDTCRTKTIEDIDIDLSSLGLAGDSHVN